MLDLLFRTRPVWMKGHGVMHKMLPRARRLGFRLYSHVESYQSGVAPGIQYRSCYYAKYSSKFADSHPIYKKRINKYDKWGDRYRNV